MVWESGGAPAQLLLHCAPPRGARFLAVQRGRRGERRAALRGGAGSRALGGRWGGGLLLGGGEIEPLTLPLQMQGSPSASLPHFSCPCPLPLREAGSDHCPHV